MYDQWLTIVGAVISVFAVIGIGVAVRRAGWLTEEADQSLLKLIMRVLFPCLVFSAVSDNPKLMQAGNLLVPPLVGAATISIGLLAAGALTRCGRRVTGLRDKGERRTFMMSVAFYNYTFVPIPLISVLFGDDTLGVLFVHNVGAGLAIYTIGVALVSGELSGRWWRRMVNGPSIAIVIALVANYLGAGQRMPQFVITAVEWLGQAAVPMALVAIGAIAADQFRSTERVSSPADGVRIMVWAYLLRLCLLPAITLVLAIWLPVSLELARVMVIIAAMPSATFSIILAQHYGGVPGIAMRVALCTSVASLFTIPIWIPLGMELCGLGPLPN